MPYYFCIVGTRDNLLYEVDLTMRPPAAPAGSSTPGSAPAAEMPSGDSARPSSIFGFSNALGALTGSFGNTRPGTHMPTFDTPMDEASAATSAQVGDHYMLQMIAHGSLDILEDKQFLDNAVYLKQLDKISDWNVSAFLVPGNAKFIVLHEHMHEDGIRNFLMDVWELWVKASMNPFRQPNDPITSPSFDQKIRASARKHL
ncbi:TRAPP subunit [Malassezia vespertilionis]|uniref:Sedlin n=1 Tax=Malassezia vespertilionis TaxID=2020962 RepID=A0A2N1JAQ8_9BASI|nr:TRAPP subunit [Malassezia vespertilionis]PKI83640.1 hypothetical protein MVES_002599 [Malassezia vespertilionis]WFD07387.1 TRAPP subunit [Malassezia vespertilionis]